MYVEVKIQKRLRLLEKKQEIPYQIVSCEIFEDASDEDEDMALSLKQDINTALNGHQRATKPGSFLNC